MTNSPASASTPETEQTIRWFRFQRSQPRSPRPPTRMPTEPSTNMPKPTVSLIASFSQLAFRARRSGTGEDTPPGPSGTRGTSALPGAGHRPRAPRLAA